MKMVTCKTPMLPPMNEAGATEMRWRQYGRRARVPDQTEDIRTATQRAAHQGSARCAARRLSATFGAWREAHLSTNDLWLVLGRAPRIASAMILP